MLAPLYDNNDLKLCMFSLDLLSLCIASYLGDALADVIYKRHYFIRERTIFQNDVVDFKMGDLWYSRMKELFVTFM